MFFCVSSGNCRYMQKIWQWYTSSIGKKGGKISSNDIISSAQQVMVSAHGERLDDDLFWQWQH